MRRERRVGRRCRSTMAQQEVLAGWVDAGLEPGADAPARIRLRDIVEPISNRAGERCSVEGVWRLLRRPCVFKGLRAPGVPGASLPHKMTWQEYQQVGGCCGKVCNSWCMVATRFYSPVGGSHASAGPLKVSSADVLAAG